MCDFRLNCGPCALSEKQLCLYFYNLSIETSKHHNVHLQLRTMQLVKMKLLKHAEVRMVEYLVEDGMPATLSVRVEQRLYRNAVREQKYDA